MRIPLSIPGGAVDDSHREMGGIPQTPMTSPSASTLTMRHTSTAGSPASGAGAWSRRSSMVPRSATGTSSWAVAGRNPRAVWRTTTRRTTSRRTVRTERVVWSRSFREPDAVPGPVRVDAAGRSGVRGGRDKEVAQPRVLTSPGRLEGERVDRCREVVGGDGSPVLPPRGGVRRGPCGRARPITGEDPVGRSREDDERRQDEDEGRPPVVGRHADQGAAPTRPPPGGKRDDDPGDGTRPPRRGRPPRRPSRRHTRVRAR